MDGCKAIRTPCETDPEGKQMNSLKTKQVNPIVAAAVIVVVLIVAGLFFWKSEQNSVVNSRPTEEEARALREGRGFMTTPTVPAQNTPQ